MANRKSYRYYKKLASKPGQTKSSAFRRLKRWLRDKRREAFNKKKVALEAETDFLDVIDRKRQEQQNKEQKDEQRGD